MKSAREPASSRPKPCASLKKPPESCPFAAPCGPRRKKNDRGQTSDFPSEISWFTPVILAHRDSALPWLVDDRSCVDVLLIFPYLADPILLDWRPRSILLGMVEARSVNVKKVHTQNTHTHTHTHPCLGRINASDIE